MASNPEDVFAALRVGGPTQATPDVPAPETEGPTDVFAPLRVPDMTNFRSPRADNTAGEEFTAGLDSGIQGLQGSMFGVAALTGRELGIKWMEDAGMEGAARNFEEAGEAGRQHASFSEISDTEDFFKWAAGSLGEAVPSLAAMFTGGGIGAAVGKKSVEMAVKKSVARRVERDLVSKGFTAEEALLSTRGLMSTPTGQAMLRDAFVRGQRVIGPATTAAVRKGGTAGVLGVSIPQQAGEIDQELLRHGIEDPGLTAVLGGIVGGALEAVPALRLMDKMFPGVDKELSKQFVKDFAVATGTQLMLEGSTEGAQEIIQLAALAYHDPSFDMFSPESRTRVVDAFAAGAIVGAVTGGGGHAIGELKAGAREVKKTAPPVFDAWKLAAAAKAGELTGKAEAQVEGALPEGFVAADNTVFEEIKNRVFGAVQPQIESIVNSLQEQVQKSTDALNGALEGGANAETASLAELAKAAHNEFLTKHGPQIDRAKAYLDEQVAFITKTAKSIKDPAERAAFISTHVEATKERLSGWLDNLRQRAAKRDEKFAAEVDNMEFPEGMLEELQRRNEEGDTTVDEEVDPLAEVGEVDAVPTLTFGKFQKEPTTTVSGKDKVQGYDDQAQAEKALAKLRKKFPESTEEDFEIREQEDGTFVIETVNPELQATHRFNQAQKRARAGRRQDRKYKIPARVFEGKDTGFDLTSPEVDVVNLAHSGRDQDPNARTLQDGIESMAAEMLARGYLDTQSANEMLAKFAETQEGKREAKARTKQDKKIEEEDQFTTVTKFPAGGKKPNGVAMANMMSFINKLEARGIKLPFGMLATKRNEDGTYSWGIPKDQQKVFRALRAKDPALAQEILDGIKRERRQETLATAAQKQGDFSRSPVAAGKSTQPKTDVGGQRRLPLGSPNPDTSAGDLGDPSGRTAGSPDVEVVGTTTIREGTAPEAGTGQQRDFAEDAAFPSGRAEDDIQRTVKILKETDESIQKTDKKTDPEKLPSEFSERNKRTDNIKRNQKTGPRDAKKKHLGPQTKHDEAILKRYGQPGRLKVMLGLDFANDGAITGAIRSLTGFVQKTLGLSNQITVMDDVGLSLLIETGAVSDPIFEQTLNDPNVHARNIRIGDRSFVYLSPQILSDPNLTVAALGHELGHHLYSVAWDALTPAAQARLRKASKTETDEQFNEWMADQLAGWITQRRGPKGAVESFFAKVGGSIRRLYDFIAGNPRFILNETFGEFADAVALKARTSVGEGTNPFNEAQLKAWFRNEGVTMYKFFGEDLENDNFDFKPLTAEGRKALARVESKYPAIAKRGLTLRNWIVSAYKLVLSPSTSVVRAMPYKAAQQLAVMFNRQKHGDPKQGQNYHQAVELMRGQFMSQFNKITKGVSDAKLAAIVARLQEKDGNPNAKFTPLEQQIRDLFDNMHKYATKAGLPVRKVTNYFPRQFSREALVNNKEKILDHLTDPNQMNGKPMGLEAARSLYNSLTDPNATDGRATRDATETPGFRAMNSRQVQDAWFDQFLDTNLKGIVGNYVNSVVKRAEFNTRLGEAMPATELDAKQAIKKGIWDPKGKMHKILADAKKQGASEKELITLEKYIDANLGQLGRDDISPGMRKFMAGVLAYQNMRVLLFTVFASLPDMVGPAIRGGGMKQQWNVLKNNIHEIANSDSALTEMARALGIVQDAMSEHIMTEYVDNHHMPPKLQKWNQAFFKYTGLNWYTDFTRKMALAVGIDYIEQSYKDSIDKSKTAQEQARGKDMLLELGLSQKQAGEWIAAGKPTYDSQSHDMNGSERKAAEALVQFVDESIMRPNASQRPIMASHPGAMLVYHLKGYMFAVHDIILKRIKFNIDESQSTAQYMAAIAPALAMMLLTAVGLELRELIQYFGSNRKPPTDRMDGWEYTWELAQRSGLTGFSQIGFDFTGADDRGITRAAGVGGPTLSQIGDFLSKPHTQTIPKAIPVIGQIPAARDQVRKVL